MWPGGECNKLVIVPLWSGNFQDVYIAAINFALLNTVMCMVLLWSCCIFSLCAVLAAVYFPYLYYLTSLCNWHPQGVDCNENIDVNYCAIKEGRGEWLASAPTWLCVWQWDEGWYRVFISRSECYVCVLLTGTGHQPDHHQVWEPCTTPICTPPATHSRYA